MISGHPSDTEPPRGIETRPPHAHGQRPWVLALLASLAAVVVAVVWLNAPETYPYGFADNVRVGVNYLIEREPAVVMLLTVAALGILLATVALRREPTQMTLRVVGVGALAQALFFAFVLGDAAIMSSLGYLVALTAPVAVVAFVVLLGRKWPRIGVTLIAVAVILGIAGLTTGTLGTLGEAVGTYYRSFLTDPEGFYPRIGWSWGWAAVAACWAWAAVTALFVLPSDDRPEEASPSRATTAATRRWGRTVTIAAALCPVPYGLLRLSWLTPWPLGGSGIDEFVMSGSLDAATRLRGGLFALAVAVGVILTLGLISRWGEIFPRWVPILAGRPVPVKLAVIPGALVAAVITLSAPGLLLTSLEDGLLEAAYMLLFFPFPIWGPLLGAAVFAYWLRRAHDPDATIDMLDIYAPARSNHDPAWPDTSSGHHRNH